MDHRELLKKYIKVVAKNVVCTFVSNKEFSEEESNELGKLAEEQFGVKRTGYAGTPSLGQAQTDNRGDLG